MSKFSAKPLSSTTAEKPGRAPRRANHEGNLRLRNGRWQARVQLGGQTLSATGSTRTEAVHLLHDMVSRHTVEPVAPSPTVGDWLAHWLEVSAQGWKPSTTERYTDIVRLHLSPTLGELPLSGLSPAHITACLTACSGVSPSTRLKVFRTLGRALNVAVYSGTLGHNPTANVEPPRARRKPPSLWTPEQAARFVEALPTEPYSALWAILLGSGCRLGEALALRWPDLDPASGTVTIRSTYCETRRWRGLTAPKTPAAYRTVTLPLFARAILRQRRSLATTSDAHMVVTSRGNTPTRALVRLAFLRACERASVPAIRVHDLRHLHASILIGEGVPLPAVADRLGHASPAVTASVYAHAIRNSDAVCAKVLETAFGDRVAGTAPAIT